MFVSYLRKIWSRRWYLVCNQRRDSRQLMGKIEDVIYILSYKRASFTDTVVAALLKELMAERDILLAVNVV
jgi:chromosomal replication initiation ATPase DnaA